MELHSIKPSLLWSALMCMCWLCVCVNILQVRGDAMTPQACNPQTSTPCQAMIGYVPLNNYNLSQIASLFSLPYTSLLGPNDIDPSLHNLSNLVLPANKPYLVPQTCGCNVNGTGTRTVTSANYTVVEGNTLSLIADSLYSRLVTYQEIASVNGIPNADQISIGQVFTIPIPCACFNQSNGAGQQLSIFLSYQIQMGDSLPTIAEAYNTSATQLQLLNSLQNISTITPTSVLFVPLSVCKANFSSDALDKDLTVLDGKYELTANSCVQCNCNNGMLHCVPAPSSLGSSCSNVTCPSSSILLGSSATSQGNGECTVRSCVYKGYTDRSGIMSELEIAEDPSCPVALPPETFYKPPSDLVASPLPTTPAETSQTTAPPPSSTATPPTSTTNTPNSTTNTPNSATMLHVGITSYSWWWCLLAASVLL